MMMIIMGLLGRLWLAFLQHRQHVLGYTSAFLRNITAEWSEIASFWNTAQNLLSSAFTIVCLTRISLPEWNEKVMSNFVAILDTFLNKWILQDYMHNLPWAATARKYIHKLFYLNQVAAKFHVSLCKFVVSCRYCKGKMHPLQEF